TRPRSSASRSMSRKSCSRRPDAGTQGGSWSATGSSQLRRFSLLAAGSRVQPGREALSHDSQRLAHLCLHGLLGDLERFGNLGVAQPVYPTELEDFAAARRQLGEGALDRGRQLFRHDRLIGPDGIIVQCLDFGFRLATYLEMPQMV